MYWPARMLQNGLLLGCAIWLESLEQKIIKEVGNFINFGRYRVSVYSTL